MNKLLANVTGEKQTNIKFLTLIRNTPMENGFLRLI